MWFITGTSRGFGRAISQAALSRGDSVVATARGPRSLDDLVAQSGGRAIAVALDVTDEAAAGTAIAAGVEAFGRIDVVVNNAGYADFGSIEQTLAEQFRAQIETNLFGVVNVSRAAIPVFRRQGHGRYIQFSTIGGRVAARTRPGGVLGGQADRTTATLTAFATTALLWRIYIHRAGAFMADAIAATTNPRRVAVLTIYAHVIMIAGIIAIAVGDELVIQHPFGHPDPAWLAVILGGPVLFLAGRAAFDYAVFGRVPGPRVIGALALVALALVALVPAMRPAPPLAVAVAAALVLTGVAVADAVRIRRLPSEPPSPPG